jgi:hypothetical protein
MQISKFPIVCGVALLCLASHPAPAQETYDTPEAARLREALRQKMAEGKASEAVAPAPSTAPSPTPEVVAPARVVTEPAPVAPAPEPVVAEPVLAPATTPVAETQPAPVSVPQESVPATVGDSAQAAHLRQVLRERMAQGSASVVTSNPVAAPVSSVSAEPTTLQATAILNSSTTVIPAPAPVVPEAAPALPISGSKAERLASLLQQYKSDQITPQQYHEARSKILAE